MLKIKSCVENKELCSKQKVVFKTEKVVLKIKSCVENKNHTVKMMLQTKSCVDYYMLCTKSCVANKKLL